jgi:tetratricopeptide (TPR) repeat protein
MTLQQVTDWLERLELGQYAEAFRDNDIDGATLRTLTDAELEKVGVASLGHRKRLRAEIAKLAPPDYPLKERPDEDAWVAEAAQTLAAQWHQAAAHQRIIDHWPAPIAHEVWMLHQLLADGEPVGAFYQLRDVLEVLIKLPAAIMARDLIAGAPDLPIPSEKNAPAADLIRRTLLADSPSTGTWRALAQALAEAIHTAPAAIRALLIAPGVAGLFYQAATGGPGAKPRQTALCAALLNLVTWRNRDIGHGGYRPDPAEHLDCLSRLLLGCGRPGGRHSHCDPVNLGQALTTAVDTDPWHGLELRIAHTRPDTPPHETPLIGARALHLEHRGGWYEASDAPLLLVAADGRRLDLGPYAAARRCDHCDHQDVFLYNGHQGSRGADPTRRRYLFLEYRLAHPLERRWHQARDLVAEGEHLPLASAAAAPPDGMAIETAIDFDRQDLVMLLEDIALTRRFLSPGYLNQALRDFLAARDRGILWLTAPAHVGKTAFVVGLGTGLAWQGADHPLSPTHTDCPRGVPVASFLIRREYCYGPQVFADDLRQTLADALNLSGKNARQEGLPTLATAAADRAQTFVDWIGALRARAAGTIGLGPADPLLICLDGLDELPEPLAAPAAGGGSILDYLPAPDRLPAGTYLLLTSRPRDDLDADCPAWVWERVAPLVTGDQAQRLPIQLADPGYRALLRDYVRRELAGPLAEALDLAFGTWTQDRTPTVLAADTALARDLLALHDARGVPIARRLRQAWHARWPNRPEGEDPPAALLADGWRRLDALFETLYEKADQRFLYLAMLTDRLVERDLDLTALPSLTAGDQLHRDWLDGLRLLPPKLADLARRVLLLLAAAEQVHDQYRTLDPPPVAAEFHGLPLDLLFDLLQGTESGDGTHRGTAAAVGPGPARRPLPTLVYALYRLKPVLGSWKGDAATHSRFRIGLKGLTAAIAAHPDWSADLGRTHRRLAADCAALLDDASGADGLGAADRYLLHTALGHATHAGAEMVAGLGRHPSLLDLLRAQDQAGATAWPAAHRAAILWRTLALAWQDLMAAPADALADDLGRPADLFARGLHHHWLQDLAAAIADYDATIGLIEGSRDLNRAHGGEGGWTVRLRNQMALAYQNRGLARAEQGDLAAAIANYDTAIGLMEDLRDLACAQGGEFGSALRLRNDLASTYQNRGAARANRGDLAAAIADYHIAIRLREGIRDLARAQGGEAGWALPLRNDLATVYQNRGLACADQGDLSAAIADYDAAIVLMEGIRDLARAQGGERGWALPLRNDLASAYQNRGLAGADQGDLAAAIADYDAAIGLMEGIRDLARAQGGEAGWTLSLRNDLARTHRNRGLAWADQGDLSAAIADYDAAIRLMEGIRDLARVQGGEAAWTLPLRNDLARAYDSRGIAQADQGDLAAAIADHDAAIRLMEDIRDLARAQGGEAGWTLSLRNDLARAYQNRGGVRRRQGDLPGAIAGIEAAIGLMGNIRDLARAQGGEAGWTLSLRNDLARAYQNRGGARLQQGDLPGAIAGFDAAIRLMEEIRDRARAQGGEKGWTLPLRNDLARVYHNRGSTRRQQGDLPAAIADYDLAIRLREEVCGLARAQSGEAGWALSMRNDLACTYQNRALAKQGDRAAAIADFNAAIRLWEGIRDLTRTQGGETGWPTPWRLELARTLCGRALAQGNGQGRADIAAARAIADGLDAGGHPDAARLVRAMCGVLAIRRPISAPRR